MAETQLSVYLLAAARTVKFPIFPSRRDIRGRRRPSPAGDSEYVRVKGGEDGHGRDGEYDLEARDLSAGHRLGRFGRDEQEAGRVRKDDPECGSLPPPEVEVPRSGE